MKSALLAWEMGAGRGHVVTLRTVAEAVADRFTFDAALRDLTFSHELSGLCDAVQGPWLAYSGDYRVSLGNPATASWGETMGDFGFRRPDILRQSIEWWWGVMREHRYDVVVADSAPCALLAARGLGIPAVAVGVGYMLPPPSMDAFPILMPEYPTRIYEEAEILAHVNAAAAEFGVPPLGHLPEVYASADQLAFTLDMLDPYGAWRDAPLLPPIVGGVAEPASGGDEIFVYFTGAERKETALWQALGGLGLPVRAYVPGIDESSVAEIAGLGIAVERSPVPVNVIARRSRLVVNAAQHGTVCMALGAGIPQIAVPRHREQMFNAAAVARHGVLRASKAGETTAESFRALVLEAYHDRGFAQRAAKMAAELRPVFQASQRKAIRRRLAAAMDVAASG